MMFLNKKNSKTFFIQHISRSDENFLYSLSVDCFHYDDDDDCDDGRHHARNQEKCRRKVRGSMETFGVRRRVRR